jgi:hypothetical protein
VEALGCGVAVCVAVGVADAVADGDAEGVADVVVGPAVSELDGSLLWLPEFALPVEEPVADLPQTTDETGVPDISSNPVTHPMTSTKAASAGTP